MGGWGGGVRVCACLILPECLCTMYVCMCVCVCVCVCGVTACWRCDKQKATGSRIGPPDTASFAWLTASVWTHTHTHTPERERERESYDDKKLQQPHKYPPPLTPSL